MSEAIEHTMLCTYIKTNYPNVVFLSDASGLKMTMGMAVKWSKMKSDRGIPDLIILYPNSIYHGLMIELKRTGEKLYMKDGSFKTDHLKEQDLVLKKLRACGYYATFAIGFEEAKKIIDEYME